MFSNLSSSSISLATVTPSLVMRGAPKLLSSTTLRPFGPRVTFSALARVSTPRSMRSRASPENFTSFAAISNHSIDFDAISGDHAHDVGLLHDQEFLAVELDLGARPLAEQHAIAWLEIDRDQLAAFVAAARTDGNDLAFLRLLLGGIRNDDSAFGFLLGFDAAYDDAVVQGTKLGLGHGFLLALVRVS